MEHDDTRAFALVRDHQAATALKRRLMRAGLSANHVSLLAAHPSQFDMLRASARSRFAEGTALGASLGAVFGGLAAVSLLGVPGVGALLGVPLSVAAAGATLGCISGSLAGNLLGDRMPTWSAQRYAESLISAGQGVVVQIRVDSEVDRSLVHHVLDEQRAVRLELSFPPSSTTSRPALAHI